MGLKVLALFSVICVVYGDVYMQNMRGSNNRLDGANRNRRNANRLFDSQNNDRGGYNVGRGMEYYVGSKLRLEWTNQHSCGEVNNNCEIIVQYMCHDLIRDGSTTKTIPEHNKNCFKKDCNHDYEYGMHENNTYYQECKYTERNKGLFTADQKVRRTAKTTRQNPNGKRRGYECPEERDYYPYWRPSPWKDVVIMTNNVSRCDYYKKESQNVKSRFRCVLPPGYMEYLKSRGDNRGGTQYIPINQADCEKLTHDGVSGRWVEEPAHGIPSPACIKSKKSRDNHNGNGKGGETNSYDWFIPNDIHAQCVLRMRYNISTNDFENWDTFAIDNEAPVYKNFGMHETTAEEHGYEFKNNPVVHPFRVMENGQNIAKAFKLRLAINTAQFARTFQDRSHAFSILARPTSIPVDAEIHNLNVRGKRGNIVQTYPATEYDFVPTNLTLKCDESYVHFQWTGSNSNPGNNDGQGRAQTDRSNVCLLDKNKYPKAGDYHDENKYGHYGSSYPSDMRKGENFMGLDDESEQKLCTSGTVNGDNVELDDAGVYYNHRHHSPKDGGLVKCRCEAKTKLSADGTEIEVKVNGVWYYLCTRNNNFTNRSQKAKIVCENV